MQTWKVALAMGGLVLIGFVAGFFTNRTLTQQKIERIAEWRYERGFERKLLHIVDATPEQVEEIGPIIEKYAKSNAEAHRTLRQQQRTSIELMLAEIKPYLTSEQLDRLERFGKRFKEETRRKNKKMNRRKKEFQRQQRGKNKKNYDHREKRQE